MRRASSSVVLCLFLASAAYAQTLGTITGEVKDSSGAVVPGATVTAVNKATNATRTTSSNAVGLFDFPALPPGQYSVKIELDGFKTSTREIELQVQQTARVDFAMELGTISEMATVTGVSPLVETSNATVGTVIENRRIVELPLNGRNYLQLVALSPNVSAEFAGAGQAVGRQASQVNVVTKSGTNNLHGTIFEFHRDDAWDARPYSFTAQQAAAPKAPFKWDQYGYTAGGPVMKNRLFFMSNFEGYRDRKQFQSLYSVPSAAMRSGDFSELFANLGALSSQTGQRAGI